MFQPESSRFLVENSADPGLRDVTGRYKLPCAQLLGYVNIFMFIGAPFGG
jgi:hypothetical protein